MRYTHTQTDKMSLYTKWLDINFGFVALPFALTVFFKDIWILFVDICRTNTTPGVLITTSNEMMTPPPLYPSHIYERQFCMEIGIFQFLYCRKSLIVRDIKDIRVRHKNSSSMDTFCGNDNWTPASHTKHLNAIYCILFVSISWQFSHLPKEHTLSL